MFDSGSITPLTPDRLRAFVEGLPLEIVEQFIKNWRGQKEDPERSETETRLLHELLRRQRIEKYGLSSDQLSDEQLEHLEEEPGVSRPEAVIDPEANRSGQDPELAYPIEEQSGRARMPRPCRT